eukprot:TRINITY_DN110338_c0_g1_i1.p1 TRINITY_DN110338_c0_g1~~TRINITY_DN110338_c0_g1_i1.p1  ORF type:complete len:298 (-),score=49.98 TRINITY_DN110338_c0_g1_i1:129-1022(-)
MKALVQTSRHLALGRRPLGLTVVARRRAFCDSPSEESTRVAEGDEQETPSGPRVLFTAPPMKKLASDTEGALSTSAICTAGGIGAALMGIAPFTPPNPFMIALLLSVVQVQFAHGWMLRQLWAQRRRHVLEVVQEEKDGITFVTIRCDGGLTRELKLESGPASGSTPSFADIATQGQSFMFLDRNLGEVQDAEALDALLQTEQGLASEELTTEPVSGESKEEAGKFVQKFTDLTREHLKSIAGKDGGSPEQALNALIRSSQIAGIGFLLAGSTLGVMGRSSADQALTAAAQEQAKNQ